MIGFGSLFKRSKRQVIRDNAAQGKRGEEQVKTKYEMNGYKMKRTGKGHDYKATRRNWLTGKKETKYVEVKTGGAELSPLQKKKKRSMGKKYVEERVQTNPFSSVGAGLWGSGSGKGARRRSAKSRRSGSSGTSSLGSLASGPSAGRGRRKQSSPDLGLMLGSKPKSRRSSRRKNPWSIW